jgi:hypothetical protein
MGTPKGTKQRANQMAACAKQSQSRRNRQQALGRRQQGADRAGGIWPRRTKPIWPRRTSGSRNGRAEQSQFVEKGKGTQAPRERGATWQSRAKQSQFRRDRQQRLAQAGRERIGRDVAAQNKANFAGDAATGGGQPEALGLAGRRPTGDHRVFALGDGNTFTITVTYDTLELYGTVVGKREFAIRRAD